jgi:hypothetical protein
MRCCLAALILDKTLMINIGGVGGMMKKKDGIDEKESGKKDKNMSATTTSGSVSEGTAVGRILTLISTDTRTVGESAAVLCMLIYIVILYFIS